jgi:predicted TIM-barrel fold metal-dependent hydrolase
VIAFAIAGPHARSMSDSLSGEPTIDCHAHVFTAETALSKSAWTAPVGDASIERYRKTLGSFGIRRAVLAASSLHDDDNRYATDVAHKDRSIRTTVIVAPDISLERLRQLDAAGACGIRLQLRNKDLPDLRAPAYQELLRHVVDLGWHIQLHDDSRRLPAMIEAVEASGAPLVIDHFGRPDAQGVADPGFRAALAAVRRGRTWVKISGAFRLENPLQDRSLADALLEAHGPDRLLWGSDWPFVGFESRMTYRQALSDFARAVPDSGLRAAIDDSAARFYFGAASLANDPKADLFR